jgi:hypothetical protein
MARALDKPSVPKKETPKIKPPTIRAWHAPASNHPEPKTQPVFREKINMTKLAVTARAIKVSAPLDPAVVGTLPLPNQERIELAVSCDGLRYAATIATKSLRKAKNIISANGADAVFVLLQGRLKGHEIVECGFIAQIKTKPPCGP